MMPTRCRLHQELNNRKVVEGEAAVAQVEGEVGGYSLNG